MDFRTLLAERLPRHRAPAGLRQRLEARLGDARPPAPADVAARGGGWRAWVSPFVSACAAAALVLVATQVAQHRGPTGAPSELVTEAVNDHLRVITSQHPVEIESGGIHQVKPWFSGRLDFAPRVSFSGDDEFPLVGGSVGYFRDRKAAVFHFRRRLHAVTLLVFPHQGLPWPQSGLAQLGGLTVAEQLSRGFNVLLWRDGDLGYALISDANRQDLERLAGKLNAD